MQQFASTSLSIQFMRHIVGESSHIQVFPQFEIVAIDLCHARPSAISPPNACEYEFGLIQKSLLITEFPQSDTECLNLNITVPAEVKNGLPDLPVFCFIHGGGFGIGSNAWPQYDQARIVKLSCDLGMPVIGIGVK